MKTPRCDISFLLPASTTTFNKYACLRRRPCIHTCRIRPHAARYSTNVASLSDESVSARATRIRPIWGFWASKVHKKIVIPCPRRRWTAVHNLTPLALSSAEKSVTVEKKQTQTVTDVSTPCLSTCVDYKVIQSVDLLHGQMDETADSSVCVRYSRKSSHIRRGPWALMMMQSNKGWNDRGVVITVVHDWGGELGLARVSSLLEVSAPQTTWSACGL